MTHDIYTDLGLTATINAEGPMTRLGGAVMAPEVAEAMRQAALAAVDMPELQSRAGRIIAEVTGAEAGNLSLQARRRPCCSGPRRA